MSTKRQKFLFSMTTAGLLLLFTSVTWAQEDPSACVELGANVYQNWTKDDSGGSGMPAGEVNKDYLRCKACHGWDMMGTDGGYARRSRKDSRPNAGAGDGDSTSHVISPIMGGHGPVTADMITHGGTGRSYADGTGSWVPQDDAHSAANKAAHANGYTLGNQHPDLSAAGANAGDTVLTQEQIDCVVEFLNFPSADPSAYFSAIDTSQNPVKYTIVDTADAAAGAAYYADICFACHGDPATDHQGANNGVPAGGLLAYTQSDGKFSELAHKARWGIPDEIMTRDAIGSPTAADVANVMLYLQELGGTGFAITPGQTGTWWNGLDRSGEGLPIEVGFQPDGTMILWVTFFTYGPGGTQMWLTAFGTVDGTTVNVDVFITDGRFWGDAFDPDDGTTTPWGTGTFTFTSCTAGEMLLTPNADMLASGFTELGYSLQRFVGFVESGIACPTPAG